MMPAGRVVRVHGDSLAAAWAAVRMARLGCDVRWYTRAHPSSLRAVRVSAPQKTRLKDAALKAGLDPSFLNASEAVSGWTLLDPARNFRAEAARPSLSAWINEAPDRWIPVAPLHRLLESLALAAGVRRIELEASAPYPFDSESFGREPWILDASAADLVAWPLLRSSGQTLPTRVETVTAWLPHGRLKDQERLQFTWLEGVQAVLEPHGEEGQCVTLVGRTRALVERAWGLLKERGPASWRALFLLNAGARLEWSSVEVGLAPWDMAGAARIGRSLGRLSPLLNRAESDAFEQVERLVVRLEAAGPRHSFLPHLDAHNHDEATRLARLLDRSAHMEKLVFSGTFSRVTLGASSLLSQRLRRTLGLPV